ncbi:MAG: hypothetical protein EBZ77_08910, partial [Chitinophagia bacterium]|nr:hypothetical protein [Chitinophagia bacterium]
TYTVNITGDLIISGTGALALSTVASSSCVSNMNVGRNMTISGTNTAIGTGATTNTAINFQNASGTPCTSTLTVNGNVTNTSTASNLADWGNTSSGTTTNSAWVIKGNFSHGGTGRFYYFGSGLGGYVKFAGTSTQTFTWTNNYPSGTTSGGVGSSTQYVNFQVLSGANVVISGNVPLATATGQYSSFFVLPGGTLDMGASGIISGGSTNGGFALYPTATLITANTGGVSSSITATLNSSVGIQQGGIFHFNGTSAQVTSARMPATVRQIIINNTAGVKLSQATTDTNLQFTAGKLTLNGNNLTLLNAASGAGTSSYVNTNSGGALIRPISGLSSVVYNVGDTSYAPVTLTLSSAGTGGSFGITAKSGQHPSFGSACFSGSAYETHYWTITNTSASGPSTVTANFGYNSGDIIGGTNTGFSLQRYASSAWSGALSTTNGATPYYSQAASIALASLAGDYQAGITGVASIGASPASLSFPATLAGSVSSSLSTTGGGCNLTPSSGTLTITAPTGFKVYDGSAWVTSYTVGYSGGAVSGLTITARFEPSAGGSVTGTINITGGGMASPYAPGKYYSKATGNLDVLGTWGANTDGTGTAPVAFTNPDTFIIVNNTAPTLGAAWNTTGSTVILGDGSSAPNFTIPATYAMTGAISVKANATLTINNNAAPTINAADSNSTVVYNGSGATYNLASGATFGNLTLGGSTTTVLNCAVGTTTVKNNLSITGGKFVLASTATVYKLNISGNLNLSGTGSLAMSTLGSTSLFDTINVAGDVTSSSNAASMGTAGNTNMTINCQTGASTSPCTSILNVNGNVTNTGIAVGFIDFGNHSTGATNSALYLKGNLNFGGASRFYCLGNGLPGYVRFVGTSTQTFTYTSTFPTGTYVTPSSSNQYVNYQVMSGAKVKVSGNVPLGAVAAQPCSFTVFPGGTLDMGATGVISAGASTGGFSLYPG